MSSTRASAVCPTMRTSRPRCRRPVLPRDPSRRRLRSGDEACSDGIAPQASAAIITSPKAAASVDRSSLTSPSRGMPSGAARRKSGSVTALRITANPPASNATRNASIICSRTSCARDAPIARRTANPRRRPSARTRNRFATLAHAINNTTVTAPSSTHRDVLAVGPTMRSSTGSTTALCCSMIRA